jgi:hypothetical protein
MVWAALPKNSAAETPMKRCEVASVRTDQRCAYAS